MKPLSPEAREELLQALSDLAIDKKPPNLPAPVKQALMVELTAHAIMSHVTLGRMHFFFEDECLFKFLSKLEAITALVCLHGEEVTALCVEIIQKYHLGEDDIQPEGQAQAQ